MTAAARRAVWVLGACQCVFWGVLYYGFSIFLVPIESELDLSRATVAGAFSLGLLVMGLAAPTVGRFMDRDQGPWVFRVGIVLAVLGLAVKARAQTPGVLYAAWLILGLAMATLLYEPAFALVIRAFPDTRARLRGLAAVTVLGGLASTLFLPLISFFVSRIGWRGAVMLATVAIVAGAVMMEALVLPALKPMLAGMPSSGLSHTGGAPVDPAPPRHDRPSGLMGLSALFVTTTFSGMGLTTLLVPLLIERGHSPTAAATALAMLGIMQLPGRIWVLGGGGGSPRRLLVVPLVLQTTGLGLIAALESLPAAAVGVAFFGIGAGLHTLGRPWLVQLLYGRQHAGHWNGQIARLQGLARALGPLTTALIAGIGGTAAVFAGLGLALALWIPAAWFFAEQPHGRS